MYHVITTYTRPSADIKLFIDTDPTLKFEFVRWVTSHGAKVQFTHETTDTGEVSIASYPDETTFTEVMASFNATFPTFFTDRDAYCAANGILVKREVTVD